MGTRSKIAIRKKDNTIESIYCHWDGYPSFNGKILKEYYKTAERVQELINLGSISSLGKFIKPNPEMEHTFDNRQDDVTVAYIRDRGENEDHNKKEIFDYEAKFLRECLTSDCEYYYLFDEESNEWSYSEIPYIYDILEPKPLTDDVIND